MKPFALILSVIPFAIIFSLGYRNYIVALVCGGIAAWIAVPVEFLIDRAISYSNMGSLVLVQAFLGAAIPEELLKFLLITFTKVKIKNPKEIVVLMMLTGLGFGTLENIFYISHFPEAGNELMVIVFMVTRFLLPLMMHLLCGIIASAGILFKSFNKIGALTVAIIFHGLYDAILMKELHIVSDRIALIILLIGAAISTIILRLATNNRLSYMAP